MDYVLRTLLLLMVTPMLLAGLVHYGHVALGLACWVVLMVFVVVVAFVPFRDRVSGAMRRFLVVTVITGLALIVVTAAIGYYVATAAALCGLAFLPPYALFPVRVANVIKAAQSIVIQLSGLAGVVCVLILPPELWSAPALYASVVFLVLGRRRGALNGEQAMARAPDTPPVLYLRSFAVDERDEGEKQARLQRYLVAREEEALGYVFGALGPFVAVGDPGENLPQLGAARIYLADETWQQGVADLVDRASLVLLRVARSPGFLWEMRHVISSKRPEQVMFYFSQRLSSNELSSLYESFKAEISPLIPHPLPDRIAEHRILAFNANWEPVLAAALSTYRDNSIPLVGSAINVPFETALRRKRLAKSLAPLWAMRGIKFGDARAFGNFAIIAAAYFGGPLLAGLFIAKNLLAAGQKRTAAVAFGAAAVAAPASLWALWALLGAHVADSWSFLGGGYVKNRETAISFVLAYLVYALWQRFGGRRAHAHLALGGPRVPAWVSATLVVLAAGAMSWLTP